MNGSIFLARFLDVADCHILLLVELQHALDELVKHGLGGSGVGYGRREGKCLEEMKERLGRHDTQAGINETIYRLAGNDSRRVASFGFAWDEHSYYRGVNPEHKKNLQESFNSVETSAWLH